MRPSRNGSTTSQPCVIACSLFFCVALLVLCSAAAFGQSNEFHSNLSAGPTGVLVHSQFGGQIFGFDIDQNGTEGLLAENKTAEQWECIWPRSKPLTRRPAKSSTWCEFPQPSNTQDDFITMGVVGSSVGLFEHEIVSHQFVSRRTFGTLNPLSLNKVNGVWTPPIGAQHIIMPGGVSHNQGVPNVAVFAYDNSDNFIPYVFSSNVANNTFGPVVMITDSTNFGSVPPPIGYDSVTNQAILGGGTGAFDTPARHWRG